MEGALCPEMKSISNEYIKKETQKFFTSMFLFHPIIIKDSIYSKHD